VDDLTKAVGADRDLDIGPLNNEPSYLPLREAVFVMMLVCKYTDSAYAPDRWGEMMIGIGNSR
jgi:hypothetical protein